MPEYSDYCLDNLSKEKLFTHLLSNKKNVLLLGAGGTGKSYTIAQIKEILDERGTRYALLGTTGISSVNICGQTLHRWSGTGIDFDLSTILILENIISIPEVLNRWKTAEMIILDEISMLGCRHFEILDYIGKKIRCNDELFGGIQLLFCGDFLQLPPINDEWVFKSEKFKDWETIEFTEPMRYPDLKYFELLQRLRVGKMTQKDYDVLKKRFSAYHQIKDKIDDFEIKPTIVYSKKSDVNFMNDTELRKLQGKSLIYNSLDHTYLTDDKNMSVTYIDRKESIIDNSVPEKSEFKIGAQVILKINHDVENGLCNGSRGIITDINFIDNLLKVKFKNEKEEWFGVHEWKN